MGNGEATRNAIREYVEENGSATGPELARHLGITPQAISLHVREMIVAGELLKTGSTRAARYFPSTAAPPARTIKRRLPLKSLDESVVYEDVAIGLNLSRLPDNVEAVIHYAFTEILNNAIDHSKADHCDIEVSVDTATVGFTVRDPGIGVFFSIADKLDLPDEQTAMVELVKGKTTTMPEAHSGEGIFFVSRAADRFVLRSHRLQIEWDHDKDDVFVSDRRFIKGTLVRFDIRADSRKRLEEVFSEFAPAEYDYQFRKTRVLVKLLRKDYVSRSEAKRLLHNLDRFSEIELDMREVRNVGQGFADEIFRVFVAAHPDVRVRAINASDAVDAMIRHSTSQSDT